MTSSSDVTITAHRAPLDSKPVAVVNGVVVEDLQRECLTRSAELSTLVDTLLARVRATKRQPSTAASTPPPAATVPATEPPTAVLPKAPASPLGDGDPDTVQRVLAEADEWLVGAESLSERTNATSEPAEAASNHESTLVEVDSRAQAALEEQLRSVEQRLAKATVEIESQARARAAVQQELDELRSSSTNAHHLGGSDGEHGRDEAWEPLWHPTAEAAIASARQGEAEARRELAQLKQQLVQEQAVGAGATKKDMSTSDATALEKHSGAVSIHHDLGAVDAADLSAAASVASAAFSALSAAASSSDPNDPRNAVNGAAAGVDDAVQSLRALFLQWSPLLHLQCTPVLEQAVARWVIVDEATKSSEPRRN